MNLKTSYEKITIGRCIELCQVYNLFAVIEAGKVMGFKKEKNDDNAGK